MFSAILFRVFCVHSVCSTGSHVCLCVERRERTQKQIQIHVPTKATHSCWAWAKSTELQYSVYLVLIRKRYISCSFRLFWLSIAFLLCRDPPLRLHRCVLLAPLISIRQMDVMPIILMWTCWKLERNVQISAPFYWKYHRLFTSKTNFTRHSCEQENATFISTVNFFRLYGL